MDISAKIAEELKISVKQVNAAVELLDSGCTVPFIARYRKEATGSLNDEQMRNLDKRLTALRNLEEKKAQVIASITEQGKMTDEIMKELEAAETVTRVDDIYRPFRPKRKTRGSVAVAKGLTPLADMILASEMDCPVTELAVDYVNPDADDELLRVKTPEEAVQGALDILAERFSDDADIRETVRRITYDKGNLVSAVAKGIAKEDTDESDKTKSVGESTVGGKAADSGTKKNSSAAGRRKTTAPGITTVYENYYDFSEPVAKLPGHRILAINRGEKEKILTVKVEAPADEITELMKQRLIVKDNKYTRDMLADTIADSYTRLIAPSVERDIRNELTDRAQDGAIDVFGKNLRQLLMQPPISGISVLGWDPAFRTGCKIAVVDATGKVVDTTVVYPTAPTTPEKIRAAKDKIKSLVKKHNVSLISCGNGTASRESEQIIVEIIHELTDEGYAPKLADGSKGTLAYIITNEAGASVYSASELATEEFPEFDVGQRSAASIARRVQDPLAELVKIPPEAIGVGQYQHDCDSTKLSTTLGGVVEDCVNSVGVDLNTASTELLKYISGITKKTAKSIVDCREASGRFNSREELKKVKGLGPKAFEQCAGFLRIPGGTNPLDNTAVHPESYELAEKILKKYGLSTDDVRMGTVSLIIRDSGRAAGEFGVGQITFDEVVKELTGEVRDPREDMPKPLLRSDVLSMDDLTEGMVLTGTVRNVIDFGAFVDIGVHEDGLVHISQLTTKYVKHPLDVVSVGDIVKVEVLSVDKNRKRISLSMKGYNPDIDRKVKSRR